MRSARITKYAVEKFERTLDRFRGQVASLLVRVRDINGVRGGISSVRSSYSSSTAGGICGLTWRMGRNGSGLPLDISAARSNTSGGLLAAK